MMSSSLQSLVYWESPAHSAAVFLPVTAVLVSLGCSSLISVVSWSGLLLLGLVFLLHVSSALLDKLAKPNPIRDPLAQLGQMDLTVSQEAVAKLSSCLVSEFNCCATTLKKIILVEDWLSTLKFAGLCYLLSFIGGWFNALSLVTLAWIATFTLPKIYLNNKAACDELAGKACVQLRTLQNKVAAVTGRGGGAAAVQKKDE